MRRCLLLICVFSLWSAVPAQALTVLQTFAGRGNDVTINYPSALTSGTHVFLAVIINSLTQTLSIADITTTVVPIAGPLDHTTQSLRGYFVCYPSEAGDTDFQAVTSGSGAAMVVGAEVFGGSCNQDGSAAFSENANLAHDVASPTATTMTGSLVLGAVESTSVSNFSVDTGTSIQAEGAAVGDDIVGGNNVGVGLGQHFIAGAPGVQPVRFDSFSNETSLVIMAAIKPAAGGGDLMMTGIGGNQ